MSLVNQLKIGSSVIVVNTTEPFRVFDIVANNTDKPIYRFGFLERLTKWDPKRKDWFYCLFDRPGEDDKVTVTMTDDLYFVLDFLNETKGILILPDINSIAKPLARVFFEYCLSFRTALRQNDSDKYRHQIICVSNDIADLPSIFLQSAQVVELDLPNEDELGGYVDHLVDNMPGIEVSDQEKSLIVQSGKGLTEKDFFNITINEAVSNKEISSLNVFNQKRELLKAHDILDIRRPEFTLDDIGGLDLAKNLITKLAWLWNNPEKRKELGIKPMNKALFVGVPGVGKSMICEAAGSAMNLEVAKGGVSQSLSKWVGESEQNMRRTFKTLTAIAPVIFWIDEFGRDMGGSGVANDGGTTDRVHGEFLTGLQELDANVFLLAAANKIDALPPEMIRSGRFDVIMFVGFPTIAERIEIFHNVLKSDSERHDLKALAEATDLFTGAEITAVIEEAKFDIGTTELRPPTTSEIIRAAKALKNRVWINKNPEIIEMYRRAKVEWKWASSGQQHEADEILARATKKVHSINTPKRASVLPSDRGLGESSSKNGWL